MLAIGLPAEIAHGSLRLSLGRFNTEKDVDYVLEKLPGIVKKLREKIPQLKELPNETSIKPLVEPEGFKVVQFVDEPEYYLAVVEKV